MRIAEQCINKNSLVVLPTGLGKTIIAVLAARKILDLYPEDSKIIILAPTRPLINQHYETFLKFLPIANYPRTSAISIYNISLSKSTPITAIAYTNITTLNTR